MNCKFTLQYDKSGHTAQPVDDNDHIKDMIMQVLFTSPGERADRPTFGAGLLQLTFQPNSDELSTTTQFLVKGALQQWLGDLILVNDVQVASDDGTLTVDISYQVRATQQSYIATFSNLDN